MQNFMKLTAAVHELSTEH